MTTDVTMNKIAAHIKRIGASFARKTMFRSVMVITLLVSMLLNGCTTLLTGPVNAQPIDFSDLDDKSGITALGIQDSDRLRVKINYGDAADFDANKYSALYLDAFCVAPDLTNELQYVTYFDLLETYEDAEDGITFVYAYRTRKYADGATREDADQYKDVSDDADIVMYPEVKAEENIPLSKDSYIVLATYSFARGKDSYHEIARVKSNEERFCQTKVSYTNSGTYKPKFYSILDGTKLYIFDADNVKAFASKQKTCFLLSKVSTDGFASDVNDASATDFSETNWPATVAGNCSYSTEPIKVTKAGFVKCVDFAEEFSRLTGSEVYRSIVKGNMGTDWTMDVYDYSIYTDHSVTKLFFDITVTSTDYQVSSGEEDKIDQFNEDGTLKELDDESKAYAEKSSEEISKEAKSANPHNWSYDFVGITTVENIGTVDVDFKYYATSDNTMDYYAVLADPKGMTEEEDPLNKNYRDYFGAYRYLYKKDGTPPLDLLSRNNQPGMILYGNKDLDGDAYWFSPSVNKKTDVTYYWTVNGEDYNIDSLLDFEDRYNKRVVDSSSYAFENTEYTLASYQYVYDQENYRPYILNPNGDFAILFESYVVGDLGLTTPYSTTYNNAVTPDDDKLIAGYYYDEDGDLDRYLYNTRYNYVVGGLKGKLENGVLHTLLLLTPSTEHKGKYIYDNHAIFYTKDTVTKAFDLNLLPEAFLYSGDYLNSWADETYFLNKTKTDVGALQSIEPVLIGGQIYIYYIYENAIEIATPVDETDDGRKYYDSMESFMKTVPGSTYYQVDLSKFFVNKDIQKQTTISLDVNYEKENKITQALDEKLNDETIAGIQVNDFSNTSGEMVTFTVKDSNSSITATYSVEGIIYRSQDGKDLGSLTYDQALTIVNGTSTVSSYLTNADIVNNWEDSGKVYSSKGYSLKDSLLNEGLSHRYVIDMKQGEGKISYSIYDTVSGTYSLVTSGEFEQVSELTTQRVDAIDVKTWNSVCRYMESKLTVKTENKFSESKGTYAYGEYYKPRNLVYFSGALEREQDDTYLASVTPSYGLGLYNMETGRYFLPNFQRHEITYKITHRYERTDDVVNPIDDLTEVSDEISALSNMACYGVYKNNGYTKDSETYPYLFMGYDRDDITYTDIEILRAKMVPFGVAFYDESKDERVHPEIISVTDKEHSYGYYRDFLPADGDDVVYYLRDARYENNGNMIVDRSMFHGDDPTDEPFEPSNPDEVSPSGDGSDDKKPDDGKKPSSDDDKKPGGTDSNDDKKPGGTDSTDNKTPGGNTNPSGQVNPPVDNPTDGTNPDDNNNNNTNPGGNSDPSNPDYPDNTGTPSPDGLDGTDDNPDDGEDSLDPTDQNGSGGNSGDIGTVGIPVSDNSISGNNVSENQVDGEGGERNLPWWLLLIILLALCIIAFIVYRLKNGLKVLPESVKNFFVGIFGKKEEEEEEIKEQTEEESDEKSDDDENISEYEDESDESEENWYVDLDSDDEDDE